jgi:hypothetical protein
LLPVYIDAQSSIAMTSQKRPIVETAYVEKHIVLSVGVAAKGKVLAHLYPLG